MRTKTLTTIDLRALGCSLLACWAVMALTACNVTLDVGPGCDGALRACMVDGVTTCVAVATDEAHCGACGQTCDGTCLDGMCCPGDAPRICGEDAGVCVDVMTDAANCGVCGQVCASGACVAGSCCDSATPDACPSSAGGACVSLASDVDNCGSCGHSCGDASCLEGLCCGGERAAVCSGVCVDLANDGSNCGECGHLCASGFCEAGLCCAEEGKMVCGDGTGVLNCVDLSTDPNNCGACGEGCSTGACEDGTCCTQACGSVCLPTRYELLRAWGGHEGLAARLIDLDGDGFDDAIWNIQIEGQMEIVWGNVLGLSSPTIVPTGRVGAGMAAGDVDEDGNLDIVASIQAMGPPIANEIRVFFGDGHRGFGRPAILRQEANPGWVTLMDTNADGHLDIVVRLMGANCTAVRLADGEGGFAPSQCVIPYATLSDNESLRTVDLNRDGVPELLDARIGTEVAIWVHHFADGAVVSSELLPLAVTSSLRSMDVADVDGDGLRDVIVFEEEPTGLRIRALGSRGECVLTQGLALGSSAPSPTEYVSGAGDFDADGRIDFVGRSTCGLCPTQEYVHLGRR